MINENNKIYFCFDFVLQCSMLSFVLVINRAVCLRTHADFSATRSLALALVGWITSALCLFLLFL